MNKRKPAANNRRRTPATRQSRPKSAGRLTPKYGTWVDPRGAMQLVVRNGRHEAVYLPVRYEVRKATKKETREIMKHLREAGGIARVGS